MSVKELLRKQEAGFISLHDVLTRMAGLDDSTYQEAAIALHRLLLSAEEGQRPKWYECAELHGKGPASSKRSDDAWVRLRKIALHGESASWDMDDDIPF